MINKNRIIQFGLLASLVLGVFVVIPKTNAEFGNNAVVTAHVFDAAVDSPVANIDIDFNTFDATNEEYIQCARDGTGIYFSRTIDFGTTYVVNHVFIATGLSCELKAIADDHFYAIVGNSIYHSTDDGATWSQLGTSITLPFGGGSVLGNCFDVQTSGTVISVVLIGNGPGAGSYYYQSFDSATSWSFSGISNNQDAHCAIALAADTAKAGIILGTGTNLYRTSNYGSSFIATVFSSGGFEGASGIEISGPSYYFAADAPVGFNSARKVAVFAANVNNPSQAIILSSLTNELPEGNIGYVKITALSLPFTEFGVAWEDLNCGCMGVRAVSGTSHAIVRLNVLVAAAANTPFFDLAFRQRGTDAPGNTPDQNHAILEDGNTDYTILSDDVPPTSGTSSSSGTSTGPGGVSVCTNCAIPGYNNWVMDNVIGQANPGEDIDFISTAGETNGLIGIAFHQVTSANVGFAIGSHSVGFTVKTLDIAPSDTSDVKPHLVRFNNTSWLISVGVGTANKVYKTFDSGLTWALVLSRTVTSGISGELVNNGNTVLFATLQTTTVTISASQNAGNTWSVINSFAGSVIPAVVVLSGQSFRLLTSSGTSLSPSDIKESKTDDGGAFWSSFTSISGTTGTSGNTQVNAIKSGNGRAATWLSCVLSCSVTPQYKARYGYQATPLTSQAFTVQDMENQNTGIKGLVSNNMASSSDGEIAVIDQTTGIPSIHYSILPTTTVTLLVTPLPDGDGTAMPVMQQQRIYVILSNESFGGRLEVWSASTLAQPGAETPPSPDTTVTLTGITGFDAYDNGEYAIVRSNGGADVKVYTGESLIQTFTETDTCSRQHGVVALGSTGFGYLKCSAGGQVDEIHFIDAFGNSYPLTLCISACPSTLFNINSFSGSDEDKIFDIVSAFPGAVENQGGIGNTCSPPDTTSIHGFDLVASGTDFKVYGLGIGATERKRNCGASLTYPDVEDLNYHTINYGTQTANAICSNEAGKAYLVQNAASTKGYLLSDVRDTGNTETPFTADLPYDITLSDVFTGTTAINQAIDIDCSPNLVVVLKSATTLILYAPTSQQTLLTKTIVGGINVAISRDNRCLAYTDTTNTYVLYASNGTLIQSFANPAGSEFDLEIDATCSRMWIATTTNIGYYNINIFTGDVNTSATTSSSGSGSSSGTSSSGTTSFGGIGTAPSRPFGIDIQYTADGLGLSVLSVQVLIGLILVVVFSVWMFKFTGSVTLAIVGAGLGLIVATVMALVPPWVVMAIVLFLIIILGKMIFGGFTGGGEE